MIIITTYRYEAPNDAGGRSTHAPGKSRMRRAWNRALEVRPFSASSWGPFFCSKWSCPGQTRAAEVLWLHSPQMMCRTVRQRWTPWWDVGPLTDSRFEVLRR